MSFQGNLGVSVSVVDSNEKPLTTDTKTTEVAQRMRKITTPSGRSALLNSFEPEGSLTFGSGQEGTSR